jgi:hypothetical protein
MVRAVRVLGRQAGVVGRAGDGELEGEEAEGEAEVVLQRARLRTRRLRGGGKRQIRGAGQTIIGGTSGRRRWPVVDLLVEKGMTDLSEHKLLAETCSFSPLSAISGVYNNLKFGWQVNLPHGDYTVQCR